MPKLILDIDTCGECPYLLRKPDVTSSLSHYDWECPELWSCAKSGDRKIQGYIEWHDKVEVPNWCPLRPQGALAVLMKLQE